MKIRPSAYFVFATAIFAVGIIIYSFAYPYLESKLLPLIIAGIVLILAVAEMVKELRTPESGHRAQPSSEAAEPADLVKSIPSMLWIVGFCLALYILGFFITVPLFTLSYLNSHGRKWTVSIVISAILMACIYVIFTTFLQVDLYPGLLFALLS